MLYVLSYSRFSIPGPSLFIQITVLKTKFYIALVYLINLIFFLLSYALYAKGGTRYRDFPRTYARKKPTQWGRSAIKGFMALGKVSPYKTRLLGIRRTNLFQTANNLHKT